MLKKPQAWAIDEDHLQQLRDVAGDGIRLYLVDGRVYEISLERFEAQKFPVDRGFGRQQAVVLGEWHEWKA